MDKNPPEGNIANPFRMEQAVALDASPEQHCTHEEVQDPGSGFPLLKNRQPPSISPDALKAIITRQPEYEKLELKIVDCRHSFEFEGGHIMGAINLSDPTFVEEFYSQHQSKGKKIALLFHCEFSSCRAPQMYAHMRNMDRQRHMEVYPDLAFPHMFLLHGGYKAFFSLHPELCEPRQYIRMLDPKYAVELRCAKESLKRSWAKVRTREGLLTRRVTADNGCDNSQITKRKVVRSLNA